ncbi:rhodanese-like domain-containing protein [Leifsonia sp. AG29]|uniref:rhodanese-like domain-containing protein n=1 Tax=Leifsonia sp. AG29 TaxID=2598860 RepID=UPI00131DB51E|nr:rhodanese-like domain-containing protein [Leifsonia sp. AG29]
MSPYLAEDEVTAARARELVEAGEAWLLDVREPHEWQAGHAPGAHHIPLGELELRKDELPEDAQILVVCHVGGRSRLVTDALSRADYPAANVAGGMAAWQSIGAPVVRDDGTPGAIV